MGSSNDNELDEQSAQPAPDTTYLDTFFHQFDDISSIRSQELRDRFWTWVPSVDSDWPSPFEGEHLTGSEVRWLIYQAWQRMAKLRDTQPESVPWDTFPLPLTGADLMGADLTGCLLSDAHLEHARLGRANLQGADLSGAHLTGANLREAHLEKASIEGADLTGAVLADAHLENANVRGSRLTGADLSGTHLEGTDLSAADLKGADLSAASLDKMTRLNDVLLTGASLDQVLLDNTNLTAVDWEQVRVIGEEITANEARVVINAFDGFGDNPFDPPNVTQAQRSDVKYGLKPNTTRAKDYAVASRTYHLLVNALRGQGLTSTADRYDYCAQEMRRRQLRYERHLGKYLGMTLLAIAAGYGYRLWQILATYLFVVIVFAAFYLFLGQEPRNVQTWWDAVQQSFNAVHGRVNFVQFQLGTWQSWLETLESIIGIGIEAIFVAALIQKLSAR